MVSLAGLCNLESFLLSTTPNLPSQFTFKSLVNSFKLPSAFGVEVKLKELKESIFFLPTLSALSIDENFYVETEPPHLRNSIYQKLSSMNIESEINENDWIAVLWRPICRLPPSRVMGSILVYYSLK